MSPSPLPERRDDGPGVYLMPFGTWKNRKLRELPISYVFWLLTLELRSPLREHLHDLVQQLHDAAGGASAEALLTSDSAPSPDGNQPAR